MNTIFPSKDSLFIDNGLTDITFSENGDGTLFIEAFDWAYDAQTGVRLTITEAQRQALHDWLNGSTNYEVR